MLFAGAIQDDNNSGTNVGRRAFGFDSEAGKVGYAIEGSGQSNLGIGHLFKPVTVYHKKLMILNILKISLF